MDAKIITCAIKISMDVEMKIDKSVLGEIVDFMQQVSYGKVVITIHNSKIVQVERREKKRFKVCKPLCKQS